MTATIRRASDSDAEFIAWAILAAQRGHRPRGWFDIALDRPEPECLAFTRELALAPSRSIWHVSRYWIAEVNGEAAAALCALRTGDIAATARPAILEAMQAAGIEAAEQAAIWQRSGYLRSCWIPGDADNWMIEHVATRPSHRGRGLVQNLLAHALDEGKRMGFTRASIPFLTGNAAAERSYARAGFGLAEEKRDAGFEAATGAPGFRRFERAI
jgi:GNAT superfamily N-acetyltransferase